MKKFLLSLAILVTMNSGAQLKTTDSTTVSTPALRRILVAAEQKKVLEQQVEILNERIAGYEGIIEALQDRDSATVSGYEKQITLMKEQRIVFEGEIKELNKQIKKLNRKVFWTSVAGLAGMGTLTFLYLTK